MPASKSATRRPTTSAIPTPPNNYGFPGRDVPFDSPTTKAGPNWGSNAGTVQHTELTLAGVYLQDQIAISRYIDLIGGIRFDHFDIDFTCRTDPEPDPRCATGTPTTNVNSTAFDRVDNVWSPRAGVVFKPIDCCRSTSATRSRSYLPPANSSPTSRRRNGHGEPRAGGVRQPAKSASSGTSRPASFFTGALFQLDRKNQFVATAPDRSQVGRRGPRAASSRSPAIYRRVGGRGRLRLPGRRGARRHGGHPGQGGRARSAPHVLAVEQVSVPAQIGPRASASSAAPACMPTSTIGELPGFARVDAALFWDINENLEAQLNVENVLDTEYYPTAHNNNNITPGLAAGVTSPRSPAASDLPGSRHPPPRP